MSPEQLAGQSVGPASDVYALALVAYELLSGQSARSGGWAQISHKALTEPAPDIRDVRAGTPPAAADVLRLGLARDPGERPDSAVALIDDLGRALQRADAPRSRRTAPLAASRPLVPADEPRVPRSLAVRSLATRPAPSPARQMLGAAPPPRVGGPWPQSPSSAQSWPRCCSAVEAATPMRSSAGVDPSGAGSPELEGEAKGKGGELRFSRSVPQAHGRSRDRRPGLLRRGGGG